MAFNIMDAIKNREQIASPETKQSGRLKVQYISVKNIVPAKEKRNYYSTEEIETLKASIAVHGVKQNLLVKSIDSGLYELIAGERRWRASSALFEEGRADCEFIPCAVEQPIDDLDQRLLLTTTNSTVRELSDYEKGLQVQEMNQILDEYERRGATIEGPRRELIMKHFGLTSGQIGRYTAIHNNLSEDFMNEYIQKEIAVSIAYELSRLPEEKQEEAYQRYKEQGGLSIRDVKQLQEIGAVEFTSSGKLSESEGGSNDPEKWLKEDEAEESSVERSIKELNTLQDKETSLYSGLEDEKMMDEARQSIPLGCELVREIKLDVPAEFGETYIQIIREKGKTEYRAMEIQKLSCGISSSGVRWGEPGFETIEEAFQDIIEKNHGKRKKDRSLLIAAGYLKDSEQADRPDAELPPDIVIDQERRAAQSNEDSAFLIIEDDAKLREQQEAKSKRATESIPEPAILRIEAAKHTMGVLGLVADKCEIEIKYAEEQDKPARAALAAAKLEYLEGLISQVQADLFKMTGDDIFEEG